MDTSKRQRLYKKKVAENASITDHTRVADAFGVSNSAKVIERGLFAFNVNFNTIAAGTDQVVVHCLLRFPPEDEVYFSLILKHDIGTFLARLEEMRSAGAPADDAEIEYADNNKNVKGYIAGDGKLYLRNKSYWNTMPTDLATISKPVVIDKVLFGIYPPAASARRSLLARQFVGYLGNSVGHQKVHEVRAWPDVSMVREDMRRMPGTIPVAEIEAGVERLGGFYPGGEVRSFHAALNFLAQKHFVILSGLSGTGKTQLAVLYARAVHGLTDRGTPDSFVTLCPVRPEWTDPTGLTGYYDVLSNRYMVPPFLEAVLLATAHRDSPVFVVLDEMNLARVEYYFADVLACAETAEALQLHSNGVPLEGSTGASIPAEIPLPSNLYIVGTINVDETTNPVSDKVLDRAMVIEMSDVRLGDFLESLVERDQGLREAMRDCAVRLTTVHGLMVGHGLGFGYRAAEEVVRYCAFAREKELGWSSEEVVDRAMTQKVLVKLRGSEKQRGLLTGLLELLEGLPSSTAFVGLLVDDLNEFGSFQAGR